RAELRPVLAQNSMRLGCAAHVAGDLEGATAWLEDAEERIRTLALRGRAPRAKLLLGWVWLERGDLERARDFFDASASMASDLHAGAAAADATWASKLVDQLEKSEAPETRKIGDPRLWASPMADVERVIVAVMRRLFARGAPLCIAV